MGGLKREVLGRWGGGTKDSGAREMRGTKEGGGLREGVREMDAMEMGVGGGGAIENEVY